MIKFENHLGAIEISQDYFANLVGHAASECFGVAGMVESTASQGLRYILKKDEAQDKGVKVRTVAGGLVIDLHIAVPTALISPPSSRALSTRYATLSRRQPVFRWQRSTYLLTI